MSVVDEMNFFKKNFCRFAMFVALMDDALVVRALCEELARDDVPVSAIDAAVTMFHMHNMSALLFDALLADERERSAWVACGAARPGGTLAAHALRAHSQLCGLSWLTSTLHRLLEAHQQHAPDVAAHAIGGELFSLAAALLTAVRNDETAALPRGARAMIARLADDDARVYLAGIAIASTVRRFAHDTSPPHRILQLLAGLFDWLAEQVCH
jgi:hypothetical protein